MEGVSNFGACDLSFRSSIYKSAFTSDAHRGVKVIDRCGSPLFSSCFVQLIVIEGTCYKIEE